jgi:hypothetical protein
MNLSVFRSLPFGDQRRIELRVETFNLFNWVNYDTSRRRRASAGFRRASMRRGTCSLR